MSIRKKREIAERDRKYDEEKKENRLWTAHVRLSRDYNTFNPNDRQLATQETLQIENKAANLLKDEGFNAYRLDHCDSGYWDFRCPDDKIEKLKRLWDELAIRVESYWSMF